MARPAAGFPVLLDAVKVWLEVPIKPPSSARRLLAVPIWVLLAQLTPVAAMQPAAVLKDPVFTRGERRRGPAPKCVSGNKRLTKCSGPKGGGIESLILTIEPD